MFHLVSSALDLFGSEDEAEAHRELIHFQNAYPSDPRAFFSNKRARQVGTSVLQRLRTKFSSQDRIEDMWLLCFKNFQRPIEEFEELTARISVKHVKRPETTPVKICQDLLGAPDPAKLRICRAGFVDGCDYISFWKENWGSQQAKVERFSDLLASSRFATPVFE